MRIFSLAAALAALVAAAVSFTLPALAQSDEAVVKVIAPQGEINKDDIVPFEVQVENVKNLAGFSFILQYDPDVFSFDSVRQSDFLGSTGREQVCNEPQSDAGSVRINCVTLRTGGVGAEGTGVLATISLKATGSGDSEVGIATLKLVANDETASTIPSTPQSAAVTVKGDGGGFNWLIWGPVIGGIALVVVGGGAFAMMRGGSRRPAAAT